MTLVVRINGVDYGPGGEGVVNGLDVTVGGANEIGTAAVHLIYPETEAYVINNMMRVEIYDTDDVVSPGFGYSAGVVADRDQDIIKGTDPAVLLDTVSVQDVSIALDLVRRPALLYEDLVIDAAELEDQVEQLVTEMQLNGHEVVNWPINAVDYVDNLTGSTILPEVRIKAGESLRDGMNKLMENARAVIAGVRPTNPGYYIQFRSNGVGDLEPCMVVYDRALTASPSFVIATDADPGEGEYKIFALKRRTSSTSLVNAQQLVWAIPGVFHIYDYTNEDSQDAYPNPFMSDGLGEDGDYGYCWAKYIMDTDSATAGEAQTRLAASVRPREFPLDSLAPVVDNIKIRPGQVVTLRIPERGIESNYPVVGVSISFPKLDDPSYTRTEITLGSRRLGLFDEGEEGIALAPDELTPTAPDAAVITSITSEQVGILFRPTVNFTHNGFVTGRCYYKDVEKEDWESVPIDRQSESPAFVRVSGFFQAGVTYEFYIVLFDRFGTPSEDSNIVEHTPVPVDPDPPTIALVTPGGNVYDRKSNKAVIKIDRSGIPSDVVRTFLKVEANMGGDSVTEEFDVNFRGDLTRVVFSVLAGAYLVITGYNVDVFGNVSEGSDPLTFRAATATKPPPPLDLGTGPVSGLSSATLGLSWAAPTNSDEDGIEDLIGGFRVTAKPATWSNVLASSTRKDEVLTEISGLPFDVEADIEVRTVDVWGNESDPATVTKTPTLLGPNLVINGTMEKESAAFEGLPENWAYDSGSNADQVFQYDGEAYMGNNSLAVTTQDISGGTTARALQYWMYRPIVFDLSDRYTLGFWMFDASADTNDLVVYMVTQNEDTGDLIFTEIDTIAVSGGIPGPWEYFEYTDINPGVTYLQRMALAFGFPDTGSESTVYIDNVSFRQQLVTRLSSSNDGTLRGEQFAPQLDAATNMSVTGRDIEKPTIDAYPAEGAAPTLPVIRAAGLIESTLYGHKFPDGTVQPTAYVPPLTGTASLDFTEVGSHASATADITVTGATPGDGCVVVPFADVGEEFTWSGWVADVDTVRVRVLNGTSSPTTPPVVAWRAMVWHYEAAEGGELDFSDEDMSGLLGLL